jgi:hypothetical protein
MAWLDGAVRRGEVSRDERLWVGVDAWLSAQTGRVVREALVDYVRSHAIQLREVVLKGTEATAEITAAQDVLDRTGFTVAVFNEGEPDEEIVLSGPLGEEVDQSAVPQEVRDAMAGVSAAELRLSRFPKYQLPGASAYCELLLTLPIEQPALALNPASQRVFHQAHWPAIPNVLAHARVCEHTDDDGNQMLVAVEVQSDRMQAARKKGFASEVAIRAREEYAAHVAELREQVANTPADSAWLSYNRTALDAAEKAWASGDFPGRGAHIFAVPDAPFRSEWPLLVMKRLLALAVSKGIDRIAWVSAEEQMKFFPQAGADGMGLFYDKVLPDLLGRYVGQWGTGVVPKYVASVGARLHMLDITPELRDAVRDGQPLFGKVLQRPGGPAARPMGTVAAAVTDALDRLRDAERRTRIEWDRRAQFNTLVRSHTALIKVRSAAAAELARLPEDTFGLAGETPDGKLMTLTGSAKCPGHWQLTLFGGDGMPWSDRQFAPDDRAEAIDEFLRECSPREVFGVSDGQAAVANMAMTAPAM